MMSMRISMSMGRRTDLVDEFGRIRWDDRVNLWAIVCSKPIDFVGNYYVEDMERKGV